MQTFFYICFGVGVGYTIIAFIIGEALDIFDFDTDLDMDASVSPLKPSVAAAFLTVFGGVGVIFVNRSGLWVSLMIAAALGALSAFAMYRFVIVPLHRAQNTSAVEQQSLVGLAAAVTEMIPQGGYGKITYHVNGNTYSSPAKAEDGGGIARNEKVQIIYIQKNTYYVRKNNA
jgi:membrane protein implicated in regulation of membrane protease activity